MNHFIKAVLAATCTLAACADPIEPDLSSNREIPTWDEFYASVHRMEDGSYIVNGDEPIRTEAELEEFYWQLASGGELIVNVVGGNDDRWVDPQQTNLTYCVSDRFGSAKAQVVAAMSSGAAMWEGVARVDFVYLPGQDASCSTRNNAVVFSVEPTKDPSLYARAFFPSYSKKSRNVLINAKNTFNGTHLPANILGHELGHTLGFRHEHTRSEAGTCFENTSWRELTSYDSNSIMHYPQCNGGPGALTFSALDAEGAVALYGAPGL
jgi:hypothetical protein